MKHASLAQWLDGSNNFRKGEDRLKTMHAPVALLLLLTTLWLQSCPHYLTNMNGGMGERRGIGYTENSEKPHFNQLSYEGKGLRHGGYHKCCFPDQNNVVWNWVRNIWLVTKRKELHFFQRIIAIHETLVYDFKPELKS